MSSYPAWKSTQLQDRIEFIDWVESEINKRLDEGERKYASSRHGFQGDPLQHAREELLDGLFYVFYAMREREELIRSNIRLSNEVEQLNR